MDFDVEALFPVRIRETLKHTGLHKVAGAMLGIDELTVKEAVAVIGARAYLRRREMQKIAAGIEALGALVGEKVAAPVGGLPWGAMLSKSVMPGLLGGTAAVLPEMMLSNEPMDQDALLKRFALGFGVGGAGGALSHLNRNVDPALKQVLSDRLRTPGA